MSPEQYLVLGFAVGLPIGVVLDRIVTPTLAHLFALLRRRERA